VVEGGQIEEDGSGRGGLEEEQGQVKTLEAETKGE
jgi:hypothetical protein